MERAPVSPQDRRRAPTIRRGPSGSKEPSCRLTPSRRPHRHQRPPPRPHHRVPADQRVRAPCRATGRRGHGGEPSRPRVHGRARLGHRPEGRPLDLADPPRPGPHGGDLRAARAAPQARVVTTFLSRRHHDDVPAAADGPAVPINPGQTLDVGDRTLTAFRPPLFDNPATVGFFDPRSRTCVASDCFGAPMAERGLAEASDVRDAAVRRPPVPAAALGHRRQPVDPRHRPERVHEDRGPAAGDGTRGDPQLTPAADGRPDLGVPGHALRGADGRPVGRPRPACARGDARELEPAATPPG